MVIMIPGSRKVADFQPSSPSRNFRTACSDDDVGVSTSLSSSHSRERTPITGGPLTGAHVRVDLSLLAGSRDRPLVHK